MGEKKVTNQKRDCAPKGLSSLVVWSKCQGKTHPTMQGKIKVALSLQNAEREVSLHPNDQPNVAVCWLLRR